MTHNVGTQVSSVSLLFSLSSLLCPFSRLLCLDIMRSNPTAAFDKSTQSQAHLRASQATRKLNKLAIKHTSKRQAKHDKQSCHKARAWRCKGTFAVSSKQVKLSKIDWI